MTLDDTVRRNDTLRTTLKGCRVLFSPSVMELDARMRGRLVYRIALYDSFHPESDHSEGVLIFAGFSVYWHLDELNGEHRLHILLGEDFA